MSLEMYRSELSSRLMTGDFASPNNRRETLELIIKWFVEYKLWEESDRFLKAFREGRMTMRQAPPEQLVYGEWGGITVKGFNASSWDLKTNDKQLVIKEPYANERQRADIASIKERMDPKKLGYSHGERLKYKNGLHDMSGSLCVPHMPKISDQMRWKHSPGSLVVGKSETEVMVFMPLPEPEDLQLYHLLSTNAKHMDSEFAGYIAMVRRRMTRLKLADSVDIGSGMRNISKTDTPKLRYGLQAPLDEQGKLTGIDRERQMKALNYRSIIPAPPDPSQVKVASAPPPVVVTKGQVPPPPLKGPPSLRGGKTKGAAEIESDLQNTNEVVIAYREHASKRFPIFAKYNHEASRWDCLRGEHSSTYFQNRTIQDEWARTVEALG